MAAWEKPIHDHRTGRKCALCGHALHDSIIHFGEDLPEAATQLAFDHGKQADLCLVLGSSLTVTPANEVPEIVGLKKNAVLAICNLQKTPLDQISGVRVFCTADDFMAKVMESLEIPIPKFILRRFLEVQVESPGDQRVQLTVRGVDSDGTPATFLRSVKLLERRRLVRSEPFVIQLRGDLEQGDPLTLELEFMGNYGEPNLIIPHKYPGCMGVAKYLLEYDPGTGIWNAL